MFESFLDIVPTERFGANQGTMGGIVKLTGPRHVATSRRLRQAGLRHEVTDGAESARVAPDLKSQADPRRLGPPKSHP